MERAAKKKTKERWWRKKKASSNFKTSECVSPTIYDAECGHKKIIHVKIKAYLNYLRYASLEKGYYVVLMSRSCYPSENRPRQGTSFCLKSDDKNLSLIRKCPYKNVKKFCVQSYISRLLKLIKLMKNYQNYIIHIYYYIQK